ncbi:MAG TPA: hypothetical protein H9937_04095 [Candidatus Alistipes stercorigallinarum]|nr:hypothetical protein [Candidatus Alistipes stercorigallinarum]
MKPPKAVIKEAQSLIDRYGDRLKYLGDVDGQKAWLFVFPDDVTVGFPFLYLYVDGEAMEVTGSEVFKFMELYGVEDVEVGSVE